MKLDLNALRLDSFSTVSLTEAPLVVFGTIGTVCDTYKCPDTCPRTGCPTQDPNHC